MYLPVDLTNLREMTGGDSDIEQMLFVEFCRSAQGCVQGLTQFSNDPQTENWRKSAHAFKGIALNIGANQLSVLCKQAQDQHMADAAAKALMLQSIKCEYALVEEYLHKVMG
jgi:HPt (histidine-containing phosphotransfer) domain-containing protein